MTRAPHGWHALWMVLISLSCCFVACNRQKTQPTTLSSSNFRSEAGASRSPVGTTQNIVQKTFSVTSSASFPFEIPPHAALPHLHGIFESYVRDAGTQPDDAANLDFLLLTQDQYENFTHNRPSEALFTVEASHNQAVNYDLPASLDQPVKYYIVFRSSAGKSKKTVNASFRIDY